MLDIQLRLGHFGDAGGQGGRDKCGEVQKALGGGVNKAVR